MIREMTYEDYDAVYALWNTIEGFHMRTVDDSMTNIRNFLQRNPGMSMVTVEDGKIVGAVLAGHDGRRGSLYHVCVAVGYRRCGYARSMVASCLAKLKEDGICKVSLIAFKKNRLGNDFWTKMGWTMRDDLNAYDLVLDASNTELIIN